MFNFLSVPKYLFSKGELVAQPSVEFENTLLAHLKRDGEELAIICFDKGSGREDSEVYAEMKSVLDLKAISINGTPYYKLGATGSLKRDGSVFLTSSLRLLKEVHQYLASSKKPLAQQAIAYFSNLITPCRNGMKVLDVKILFVEDKTEYGYDTTAVPFGVGDCHGKISLGLHNLLSSKPADLDEDGQPIFMCRESSATQFRLLGIDAPFISKGVLAPGDTGEYDLVLPLSGVKGGLIGSMEWTGRVLLGSYINSEPLTTRFGDQFLRIFPTDVLCEAGIYGLVEAEVTKLSGFQQDLPLAIRYLQESYEASGQKDDPQFIFDHIIRNIDIDKDGWLCEHPFIGVSAMETIGKRITRAVLGGTLKGQRFLMLPDDSIPYGTVESVHLGHSTCIPGKSPIVNHMEQMVLNTEYREDGLIGCVYCSHETASSMTSDFDGDQLSLLPYRPSLAPLFNHVRSMPRLPLVTKAKRPSSKTFSELAVMVFQSTLELYASLITSVYCQVTEYGWTDVLKNLVMEFSDKLQTAVDSQKHDPGYDVYSVGQADLKAHGSLFQAFQKAKNTKGIGKAPYVYVPLATSKTQKDGQERHDVGSIADLIDHANQFWVPSQFEKNLKPLLHFQDKFGVPTKNVTEVVGKFRKDFKVLRDIKDEDFTELKFARQWAADHSGDDYFVELWRSLHFHKAVVETFNDEPYIPTARLVFEAYQARCIRQATKEFVVYGASKEPAAEPVREIVSTKGQAVLPVEVRELDDKYHDLLVLGKQALKLGVVSLNLPAGRYMAIIRFRRTQNGVSKNTLLMEVVR
jgi:hypothetical protein